jgi:hypothetical protein
MGAASQLFAMRACFRQNPQPEKENKKGLV